MVINMIYDHLVKHNGKYYAAGEEVPTNEEPLFVSEVTDDNVAPDTDTDADEKSTSRRGRPKKTN